MECAKIRGEFASVMDFSNLPRYPEHDEPEPWQNERLGDVGYTERWWSVMVVFIPLLIALAMLALVITYWALNSQDHFVSSIT
jgi:hypothetical protein